MKSFFSFVNFASGVCLSVVLVSSVPVSASTLDDANAAYSNGKYKKAAVLFKKAAAEGESPALCFYNAGNSYFQLNALPQAIVSYRACVQNAPTFFKGFLNLAICYFTVNDLGRCIATGYRALQLEPTNQKTLQLMAVAYRRCGATGRAVVTYENIARLYPLLEDSYIGLGEIYRDIGDCDEAIKWLSLYPVDGKNMVYVDNLMADLYEKKGDPSREMYYLDQAFDLDKSKRWTLYRIANIQNSGGNDLVSLETCRDAMRQFPDFAEVAVLAGSIAFKHERIEEAERYYSQAVQLGSPAAVVGLSNVRNWRKAHAPQEM